MIKNALLSICFCFS